MKEIDLFLEIICTLGAVSELVRSDEYTEGSSPLWLAELNKDDKIVGEKVWLLREMCGQALSVAWRKMPEEKQKAAAAICYTIALSSSITDFINKHRKHSTDRKCCGVRIAGRLQTFLDKLDNHNTQAGKIYVRHRDISQLDKPKFSTAWRIGNALGEFGIALVEEGRLGDHWIWGTIDYFSDEHSDQSSVMFQKARGLLRQIGEIREEDGRERIIPITRGPRSVVSYRLPRRPRRREGSYDGLERLCDN